MAPPWDCSTIPKLQLPATAPSRGPGSLSGGCLGYVCLGYSKNCLILIPFRLPQISCFTLSLKCFSFDSDNCPDVRIGPLPPPTEGRPSPTNTPVFPPVPSSYQVLHGSIYSFPLVRYSCQLSAEICRCSACTSVSEGVFLMYPWREMYSMSTYSYATFFSVLF